MKRILPLALCAALLTLCLSGCVVIDVGSLYEGTGVTGKGNLERYDIAVDEFSAIKVRGYCDIRYYAGSSDAVTLEIQSNLREHYVVEVVAGELIIRTTSRINYNTGKTPILTVSAPTLTRLALEGAGAFTAYDPIVADSFALDISGAGTGKAELEVGRVTVDMSGAGSFTLSGTADAADFSMSGVGELDAMPLQTREAKVSLAGMGSVKLSCSESLRINADGMGSIQYKGSPSVDIHRSGMVGITRVD